MRDGVDKISVRDWSAMLAAAGIFLLAGATEAGILTIEIAPSEFQPADVRVEEDLDRRDLSDRRGQVVHLIPAFDETTYGSLLSVELSFAFDDMELRYFAGAETDATISGDLNVTKAFRMLPDAHAGFVAESFDSTDFLIGPYAGSSTAQPGCLFNNEFCVYLTETFLVADQTFHYDQASGLLPWFTDGEIRASMAVDLYLDFETDADNFVIAANVGTSAGPFPPYPLQLTYTYADAAPVPTPAPFALLGVSLALLYRHTYRQPMPRHRSLSYVQSI